MTDNNPLHSLIKLRHLKSASQNNWEMLNNTQKMVSGIIIEAQNVMKSFGNNAAKKQFDFDNKTLSQNISSIQESLSDFYQFIHGKKTIELESSFQKFNATLENTEDLFNNISSYPATYFYGIGAKEWSGIWDIIRSNITIVQGLGESAYIKSLMIKNFSNVEVDTLTKEIIKHIPPSFNLLEADKYKKEYLQAVADIEKESNAKDNLWDRFLNVLAGNIPFKQTPEERVMMSRWIDGEKGDL
jgi:hypothetical protein